MTTRAEAFKSQALGEQIYWTYHFVDVKAWNNQRVTLEKLRLQVVKNKMDKLFYLKRKKISILSKHIYILIVNHDFKL